MAFTDQEAGTSTSSCSKAISPVFQLLILASRFSQVTVS